MPKKNKKKKEEDFFEEEEDDEEDEDEDLEEEEEAPKPKPKPKKATKKQELPYQRIQQPAFDGIRITETGEALSMEQVIIQTFFYAKEAAENSR